MSTLALDLRGDGPCMDCGTEDNIIWYTESVFWNEAVRNQYPAAEDGILCIPCFIMRVDDAGLAPTGWLLVPQFHWETHEEQQNRRRGNP